uniref:Uncharacterized protein n=1 Tax=viral metagenome TaxID=1070528 RepID=A0A6C0JQE5_9ZZZZ
MYSFKKDIDVYIRVKDSFVLINSLSAGDYKIKLLPRGVDIVKHDKQFITSQMGKHCFNKKLPDKYWYTSLYKRGFKFTKNELINLDEYEKTTRRAEPEGYPLISITKIQYDNVLLLLVYKDNTEILVPEGVPSEALCAGIRKNEEIRDFLKFDNIVYNIHSISNDTEEIGYMINYESTLSLENCKMISNFLTFDNNCKYFCIYDYGEMEKEEKNGILISGTMEKIPKDYKQLDCMEQNSPLYWSKCINLTVPKLLKFIEEQ